MPTPREKQDYQKKYWKEYLEKKRQIHFVLESKEHELFRREAEKRKSSISKEIKRHALASIQGQESLSNEAIQQFTEVNSLLRNMANNLNQIARNLNLETKQGRIVNGSDSKKILSAIFEGLERVEVQINERLQRGVSDDH